MSDAKKPAELGALTRSQCLFFVAAMLLSLQIFMPGTALGWGETGHRVVCQIAYEELSPDARAEVDRLLDLDLRFDSFAESCLFADSPERIRWRDHFLNVPRSTLAITTLDCPLADTCVLSAIRSDFLVLLSPESSDAEKLLALKLLGHWVGDVHQPMHVSFQDDRGANSYKVESVLFEDPENANLHGAWDYLIIAQHLGDDYAQVTQVLRDSISFEERKAWQFDSPIEWANESYQIAISPAARYCVQRQGACWYSEENMMLDEGEEWRILAIDADYLQQHAWTVRQRLQQAGIRLAHLLNQSLNRDENNEEK
jgi:hypothetical protein